ncbi:hypothetical protein FNH22_22655 [Fulvivirga sp. M361]|uniref:hypothetical protein n=1 Tax=Fulvivirga sp. M361 TaxID=2594266 RepID=UPI00117BB6BA|nr:hypothetical protein [Fulvivirga sp. M361]TRX52222.1 hypothetical protein FNH22_22655 [Fulvivirga sp. M361]
MNDVDQEYFQLLKKDIANTLSVSFPEITQPIEQWKGSEISYLQEDLVNKVGGRVSEKWFYTHVKSKAGSLPRIDVLDLLSQYVGYDNWSSYKLSKKSKAGVRPFFRKRLAFLLFSGVVIISLVAVNTSLFRAGSYQFCFVDAYSKKPIPPEKLEVVILHNEESPYKARVSDECCLTLQKSTGSVRFIVRSAYYKTDTITRILNKGQDHEHILLNPDDYALMIRVFSYSDIEDWNSRRLQLEEMMADNARIFQVLYENNVPMEVYNKEEFINKLTMPIQSLRNIEVLETIYEKDKIVSLRFTEVKDETND